MKKAPKHYAIVVAAGSGERYGGNTPKQYVVMGGKPLVDFVLETLQASPLVDEIYILAKDGTLDEMKRIVHDYRISKTKAILAGGSSRRESVMIALSYIKKLGVGKDDLVAICDGDRPNQTEKMLEEGFYHADKIGAAVVAVPASDSIIYSDYGDYVNEYLPRRLIYCAQTPQVFRFSLIYKAHEKAEGNPKFEGYTDDASLIYAMKKKVKIIEGSPDNFKINTRRDGISFSYAKEEMK